METLKRIEKIKEEYKKQGLKQKELAEKANIPYETLKKILLNQTKNPRADTIRALELALNLEETDEEIVDYFCHVLPQNAVDFWDEKGEFVRFKLSSEDWQTAFKMLESLAIDKAGKKYWNKD